MVDQRSCKYKINCVRLQEKNNCLRSCGKKNPPNSLMGYEIQTGIDEKVRLIKTLPSLFVHPFSTIYRSKCCVKTQGQRNLILKVLDSSTRNAPTFLQNSIKRTILKEEIYNSSTSPRQLRSIRRLTIVPDN
jgi:hypothetical protein